LSYPRRPHELVALGEALKDTVLVKELVAIEELGLVELLNVLDLAELLDVVDGSKCLIWSRC